MLETKCLPNARDAVAPDGSDVRLLVGLKRGGMAHFALVLGLPALEADVDPGRSLGRQFDEGDVLDDVCEQTLAVAVGQARIMPKRLEVR